MYCTKEHLSTITYSSLNQYNPHAYNQPLFMLTYKNHLGTVTETPLSAFLYIRGSVPKTFYSKALSRNYRAKCHISFKVEFKSQNNISYKIVPRTSAFRAISLQITYFGIFILNINNLMFLFADMLPLRSIF